MEPRILRWYYLSVELPFLLIATVKQNAVKTKCFVMHPESTRSDSGTFPDADFGSAAGRHITDRALPVRLTCGGLHESNLPERCFIGIGASVRPPPHHRAYGSVHGQLCGQPERCHGQNPGSISTNRPLGLRMDDDGSAPPATRESNDHLQIDRVSLRATQPYAFVMFNRHRLRCDSVVTVDPQNVARFRQREVLCCLLSSCLLGRHDLL